MKRTVFLLISYLLLISFDQNVSQAMPGNLQSSADSIRLCSTPDLYNLSLAWAREYNKLYPGTKIKVTKITDPRMADIFLEKGGIAFVSDGFHIDSGKELNWQIVIGRDIIVPVFNSNNPFIKEIDKKGISAKELGLLFSSPVSRKWGTLLKNDESSIANIYLPDDLSVTKDIAEFLNTGQDKIDGKKFENQSELISAVQKDFLGIGFCKLINIVDITNQGLAGNISILPIDRNGNGILDSNEKIYDDINNFSRGVWIGKYPKTLFSNIYSVASEQPKSESITGFLKWVLNDGQNLLLTNGYSDILISERLSASDKLYDSQLYTSAGTEEKPFLKIVILFVALIILTGLFADFAVNYRRKKKSPVSAPEPVAQSFLNENSIILPKGLYFDKTHTWAYMEQNGIVKVGIDDFLQHITGPLSRIRMKKEGDRVEKGEQILSLIQNGKQLNIYAPISGVIRESNKVLDADASVINSSPYNEGWVYRIEPANWQRENQLLFMSEKHRLFIKNEFSRLKDFFAEIITPANEKYAKVVLQDGGELVDCTLSNLGPEVWEDFQTKFIDPSRQIWFYELF